MEEKEKEKEEPFCMCTLLYYVGQVPWETQSETPRSACRVFIEGAHRPSVRVREGSREQG